MSSHHPSHPVCCLSHHFHKSCYLSFSRFSCSTKRISKSKIYSLIKFILLTNNLTYYFIKFIYFLFCFFNNYFFIFRIILLNDCLFTFNCYRCFFVIVITAVVMMTRVAWSSRYNKWGKIRSNKKKFRQKIFFNEWRIDFFKRLGL